MKEKIISVLNNSGVVAIRTDTVYGLIANAFDEKAINKIYNIKHRDIKKPLCIFIKNIDELNKFIENDIPKSIIDLISKYWPGKLTVIFKKKKKVLDYLSKGKDSIGIRIPDDELLLKVLNDIDFPLAQTSCNVEGEEPCKTYEEILGKFGDIIDLIVDGGENKNNSPSTILSVEDGKIVILRKGAIDIG